MLSTQANQLLKWMRTVPVATIDIDELKKLSGLSKTSIRNALHELNEEGYITIWTE